jgi:iron complex transport system permease protein
MKFIIISISVIALFVLNLFFGSVDIPASEVVSILLGGEASSEAIRYIVVGSRLPLAATALFAGAGLAVSGLMLQTAFRNPLAGPSILGINSGASLGVAIVMLFLGGSITTSAVAWSGYVAVMIGAFAGSLLIMGLLLLFSAWLKNDLMLLITGIMMGYLTSSVIMLLNYSSTAEGVQSYVMWGMGNFNGVSLERLPLFCGVTTVGIILSLLLIKPLNIILLGSAYAQNLGINLQRVRNLLLLATGLLTAVITAYCGPISFIGLAVPHIARMIFVTDNHRILMPATLLVGALVALLCNLICIMPSRMVLPINAVTPIIGAPVILYVILKERLRR